MKAQSLVVAAAVLLAQAVPALAADGSAGATAQSESGKARYEKWCKDNNEKCRELQARREQCKADPEKCKAEQQARREQWCKANPEKCRELQAKRERCKADPKKCRAEMQAQFERRFKSADADNDGRLTREEAQKGMPMVARHFDQIDANKDGVVTREELQAARKARSGSHKGPAGPLQPEKPI